MAWKDAGIYHEEVVCAPNFCVGINHGRSTLATVIGPNLVCPCFFISIEAGITLRSFGTYQSNGLRAYWSMKRPSSKKLVGVHTQVDVDLRC